MLLHETIIKIYTTSALEVNVYTGVHRGMWCLSKVSNILIRYALYSAKRFWNQPPFLLLAAKKAVSRAGFWKSGFICYLGEDSLNPEIFSGYKVSILGWTKLSIYTKMGQQYQENTVRATGLCGLLLVITSSLFYPFVFTCPFHIWMRTK